MISAPRFHARMLPSIDRANSASGDSSIKASANEVAAGVSLVMSFSWLRLWVHSLNKAGEPTMRRRPPFRQASILAHRKRVFDPRNVRRGARTGAGGERCSAPLVLHHQA